MLLLSDGRPGSASRRDDAIADAVAAGITIHTVGLGPASDLVAVSDPDVVAAIREMAERTGGVYSAATDAEALRPIFQTLAKVSGEDSWSEHSRFHLHLRLGRDSRGL